MNKMNNIEREEVEGKRNEKEMEGREGKKKKGKLENLKQVCVGRVKAKGGEGRVEERE